MRTNLYMLIRAHKSNTWHRYHCRSEQTHQLDVLDELSAAWRNTRAIHSPGLEKVRLVQMDEAYKELVDVL
jgi:hypothetical protein